MYVSGAGPKDELFADNFRGSTGIKGLSALSSLSSICAKRRVILVVPIHICIAKSLHNANFFSTQSIDRVKLHFKLTSRVKRRTTMTT